jgi:hypothetical protein
MRLGTLIDREKFRLARFLGGNENRPRLEGRAGLMERDMCRERTRPRRKIKNEHEIPLSSD